MVLLSGFDKYRLLGLAGCFFVRLEMLPIRIHTLNIQDLNIGFITVLTPLTRLSTHENSLQDAPNSGVNHRYLNGESHNLWRKSDVRRYLSL